LAMRSQTRALESGEILGPRNLPKHVIVPNELEDLAMRLVGPYNRDVQATVSSSPDASQVLGINPYAGSMEVEVYDYLTNAKDHWFVADPGEVPTVVVGFYNGEEEPQLFVQDDPNSGQGYGNDTQGLKIRHIYGVKPLEHRSFYYMDVA